MQPRKNIEWINSLRFLATISVILIHVVGVLVDSYPSIGKQTWIAANFIVSSVRFAVPVFLMISGALMLGKKMSIGEFYQKRYLRILLPFLFWSIIYFLLKYNFSQQNFPTFITEFFSELKNGVMFHLWYVYMILYIYLLFPLINWVLLKINEKTIVICLLIWVILLALTLPFSSGFNRFLNYLGFIGYPVLGYFLYHFNRIKVPRIASVFIFIFGVISTIFLTQYFTFRYDKYFNLFYNYFSPTIVIAAIGIFLIFKDIDVQNILLKNTINVISKYSYGIYLSQIFVLGLRENFMEKAVGFWIIPDVFFTTLLVLVLSLLLTFLINKIPFVGKYISG